jgi:hypothetical protein
MKKESLHMAGWLKDVAPSDTIRQWFGHDPAKWDEFKNRRSEGFVLWTVAIFDEHFFGETPEPFDQVQIWSVRRQELKMKPWVVFQPLVE